MTNNSHTYTDIDTKTGRYSIHAYDDSSTFYDSLKADVRLGFSSTPKTLPPKYFYDARGSGLFDEITRLPEYYLTRTELDLISTAASDILGRLQPTEIVELGSGSSTKFRALLDAARYEASYLRYVPVDINAYTMIMSAQTLARDYPFLEVYGVAADIENKLSVLSYSKGRRLIMFLGSTIGNFHPQQRHNLLQQVRSALGPSDRFLLGLDLVKDANVLEAAYNDSAGVTAEFNRNILSVINRELDGDFQPQSFQHRAFYNWDASRVEMRLIATERQIAHIGKLGLDVEVAKNENIWTDSCYKFTRESATSILESSRLSLEEWYTDSAGSFALALASRG